MQCLGGSPGHCTSQHWPAPALHMLSCENFVKSMPPSLSESKATPSFCFPFKIPDDPTATTKYLCSMYTPKHKMSRISVWHIIWEIGARVKKIKRPLSKLSSITTSKTYTESCCHSPIEGCLKNSNFAHWHKCFNCKVFPSMMYLL